MSDRYTVDKALQLVADSADQAYGVLAVAWNVGTRLLQAGRH